MQILQTDLHTFLLTIVERNWFKISALPLVINLEILITFTLDDLLMPLGENWCWSLLGPEGLREYPCPPWKSNAYTMLYLGTFFESYSETVYKGQDHIDPRMSE